MATVVDHEARTPDTRASSEPRSSQRRPAPALVILCVAVVLPILASTVMALHDGWTPVGDNATLALRAGDVLRGDPPLTGMVSTSDTITDKVVDHPGPLEVWVAAVPYALFGPAGLLVTIAIINAAALVVSVVIGWRRGGAALAGAITATGLVLCWSLGTTVIRDPLNSHLELLPWFAFAIVCWDVRLGRWRSLPLAVVIGSWVSQAHVVYVPMTLVMAAGTATWMVLDHRHRGEADRRRFGRGRRESVIWSVTLGLLLSLPMLIDQFTGAGNLGRMISFADQTGQGLAVGARSMITALGAPPAWLQPTNEPFVLLQGPTAIDLLAFSTTVGLIAWVLAAAAKRRDQVKVTLLQAGLLTLLAAFLVVVRTPQGGAVLAADPMLLLRPMTAVVWLSIGWGLWGMAEPWFASRLARPPVRLAASIVGYLAVIAVVAVTVVAPAKFGGYGEGLMTPIARVNPKVVDAVDGQRMVQVNASGWAARLYLRHSVMETLERNGIKTRTGDPERAFRRGDGSRGLPTATIWVVSDQDEPTPPDPSAILIARTDLIPDGAQSAAGVRRRQLRAAIDEAGRVQLRSTDQLSVADVSREFFRWTTPPPEGQESLPADWISVDSFVELARHDLIASPQIDPTLIDQIAADSVGRFFAAEDTELAIYLRFEQ